jgi:hypothetical protein
LSLGLRSRRSPEKRDRRQLRIENEIYRTRRGFARTADNRYGCKERTPKSQAIEKRVDEHAARVRDKSMLACGSLLFADP